MKRQGKVFSTILVAIVVGAASTGCGSSGSSAKGSASPQSSVKSSGATADPVLGTPKPASGDPVTIGLVTTGDTSAAASKYEEASVAASVEYVNQYLGGLAGRPIKILTCQDKIAPTGATACANQMIAAKVPVVLSTQEPLSTYAKSLSEAGITYVAGLGTSSITTVKGTFVLADAQYQLVDAGAQVAVAKGAKRAAILTVDTPGNVGYLQSAAIPLYAAKGIDLKVVGAPPANADLTPQVTAMLRDKPDSVYVIGGPSFCVSAFSAMNIAHYTGVRIAIPECINSSSNTSIRGGLNGINELSLVTSDPSDPDVATFAAVLGRYGSGVKTTDILAAAGYQLVVGFAKAMSGLSGTVTASSVAAAFTAMPEMKLPLGGGITYQCNGTKVAGKPGLCGAQALLATFGADGKLGPTKLITG